MCSSILFAPRHIFLQYVLIIKDYSWAITDHHKAVLFGNDLAKFFQPDTDILNVSRYRRMTDILNAYVTTVLTFLS